MIRRLIKTNKSHLISSRLIKPFIKKGLYNVLMSRHNNVMEAHNIIYKGGYDISLLWRLVTLNVTETHTLHIYIMEAHHIRLFTLYIKEAHYICLACNNVLQTWCWLIRPYFSEPSSTGLNTFYCTLECLSSIIYQGGFIILLSWWCCVL